MYTSTFKAKKPAPFSGTQAGRAERDPMAGVYYLDANVVDIQKPVFNPEPAKVNGRLINSTRSWCFFRVLPTRDEFNPDEWAPPSHDDERAGQWIRRFDLFTGGATKRISFIARDPNDGSYNFQTNPARLLRKAIEDDVKSGRGKPGWDKLIYSQTQLKTIAKQAEAAGFRRAGDSEDSDQQSDSGSKWSAPLNYVQPSYFVRALVMQKGDQQLQPIAGLGESDKLPVFVMSKSLGELLMRDVAMHGYDFQLEGGTFHCAFRKGDDPWIADKFLDLRNAGVGYDLKRYTELPTSIAAHPELPTPDLSAYADLLYQKLIPFGEVFQVLEDGQQAELLSQAFAWDVLDRAWAEYPEYWNIARQIHKNVQTVEVSCPPSSQPTTAAPETPSPTPAVRQTPSTPTPRASSSASTPQPPRPQPGAVASMPAQAFPNRTQPAAPTATAAPGGADKIAAARALLKAHAAAKTDA